MIASKRFVMIFGEVFKTLHSRDRTAQILIFENVTLFVLFTNFNYVIVLISFDNRYSLPVVLRPVAFVGVGGE